MKKNILGRSGISVTPIGMGVMKIGCTQLDLPTGEGSDIVGYAIDRGIKFLVTAEWYRTY
jgi:aryl-alcohol dehydrogenase-like predicted oxidoreductase